MKKVLIVLYILIGITYLVLSNILLVYDTKELEKPVGGLTAVILGFIIYKDLKIR